MHKAVSEDQIRGVYGDTIDALYVSLVEDAAAEAERRYRAGVTAPLALQEAQTELTRAKSELQRLAGRLELRQEYAKHALPAAEVERRLQRLELLHRAAVVRARHAFAEERLTNLRKLHAVGQVEQLEVMRAEVEVLERAAEMQAIAHRLEMLGGVARSPR